MLLFIPADMLELKGCWGVWKRGAVSDKRIIDRCNRWVTE